ncbi:MAG: ribosome biogenesis GTPase Der [Dehalococcoidia bacterium]|nr:ribosome biogenesis GTPase Der [Dehalococcoidia bacterium]
MTSSDFPSSAPLLAIVGRPNVGKSALFNRLTSANRALVEDLPGTTRDRIYGAFDWNGKQVRVVDTGGLGDGQGDPFGPAIRRGVEHALSEAQAVLFVVDAAAGPTAADYEIAEMLRRANQPVLLVANKTDTRAGQQNLLELYALGLGEPFAVSAIHGKGIGDLMDAILGLVEGAEIPEPGAERIRVAIIGRPNVGKSSLTNAILGQDRVVVSDVPGTTRDPIDTPFEFEGHSMVLIDTAGIRRKGKIERGVERHSVQRAEQAADRADVVLLIIDQTEPLTAQDTHIAGYALEHGKGIILVVNKWDLAEDRSQRQQFAEQIDAQYQFMAWAPIQFTSAVTGEGIRDLLELVVHVAEVRQQRVPTSELNRAVHRAMAEHGPPTVRNQKLKVLYVTQAAVSPPTFVFFVNNPATVHFSYERFLENRIRAAFGFEGTTVRLVFRGRAEHQIGVPA